MGKTLKIDKEELLRIDRMVRRDIDIELQTPKLKHSIHKNKKQYSRQEYKKFGNHLED